jgi:hypothetical protein
MVLLQVGTRKACVAKARARADHQALVHAFGAWEEHTCARAARARLLFRSIMRTSSRLMQRAVSGWKVNCTSLVCMCLCGSGLPLKPYLI